MNSLEVTQLNIGKIITNLQSMEFLLRLFLEEITNLQKETEGDFIKYSELKVGDWVPYNYVTNFDSLGPLIKKVNSVLRTKGFSDRIDINLVDLRDSIAHGRVIAFLPDGPFHIFKFSEPTGEKTQVKVTISTKMTPGWFSQNVSETGTEIKKIIRIGKMIGLKIFQNMEF